MHRNGNWEDGERGGGGAGRGEGVEMPKIMVDVLHSSSLA